MDKYFSQKANFSVFFSSNSWLNLKDDMRLSKEAIEEFKEIYEREFGEKITDTEAYEKFLRLINFLRTILKKQTKKDQGPESPGPSLFDDEFKNAKLKE